MSIKSWPPPHRGVNVFSCKMSDWDFTNSRKTSFVKFDALNLMKGFRFKIAVATVGTGYNGDILNDKHFFPLPIRSRNLADTGALFTTDFTYHLIHSIH
ncbi:MAG TPA: hypothetical protein VI728_06200 [Syntrophales bacterium]|nr:hypothetical protein [Syntrophales bacterium]